MIFSELAIRTVFVPILFYPFTDDAQMTILPLVPNDNSACGTA